MRKKCFILFIALVLCSQILLCSCGNIGQNRIPHPPVATAVPDFSEEITDIRISATTCEDYELDFSHRKNFRNLTFLQILYGYFSDGEWHDVPAENYDYVGMFNNSSGMSKISGSHIVKIGPYIVVCYMASALSGSFETSITDTINSEVLEPFAEYYTPFTNYPTSGYGILTVDPDSILSGNELEYYVYGSFDKCYYVILEYEALPEDYEMQITTIYTDGEHSNQKQYALTMQEIKDIFNLD